MINAVATQIKGLIKDLPWVETLAGVAVPHTHYVSNGDGSEIPCTFPMVCNANPAECDPNGRFMPIVPDDYKKSIIYFEQFGSIIPQPNSDKDFSEHKGKIKLIAWLNLQQLGIHPDSMDCSCSVSGCFSAELYKIISRQKQPLEIATGCFTGSSIELSVTALPQRNVAEFQKYSYGREVLECLKYPFDFFTIEIGFTFHFCENGLLTHTPSDPIECIII